MNKEINIARGLFYKLFSILFVEEALKDGDKTVINLLEVVTKNAFEDSIKQSGENILAVINKEGIEALKKEFEFLFISPFSSKIGLTASRYFEQREGGRMLLAAKNFVCKTKVRRDENSFKAPEDHFGFLFSFLDYVIEEKLKNGGDDTFEEEIFKTLLNPFLDEFISKIEDTQEAFLYLDIANILNNFLAFERLYLNIQPPEVSNETLHIRESKKKKGFKKKFKNECDTDEYSK